MDEVQHFIYEDTEVKLTGRKARKQEQLQQTRRQPIAALEVIKFEITPVDNSTGSWKKWVKMEDLYIITEDE